MKFIDYIRGNRKGKEANRIERESMRDPFMADAIDGFDNIQGNHKERIEQLQARFANKTNRKGGSTTTAKRKPLWQAVAASAAMIFALGGYLLIDSKKTSLYAQEKQATAPLEIFVPEPFFEENEVIIEEKNEVLTEAYKPTIDNFRVNEVLNATVSKEEFEQLAQQIMNQKSDDPIEIYIPDEQSEDEAKSDKPRPAIGWARYEAYLKSSMVRPTDDACKNRHGKVAIDFSVDTNGNPYDFEVAYSLCGTSDKETIRLIQNGSKWIQGKGRARVKLEF